MPESHARWRKTSCSTSASSDCVTDSQTMRMRLYVESANGSRTRWHVSPRKRPSFVGVWLAESGERVIVERAEAEQVSKSEMVRRMLAYAATKMPKGWKP